RGMALGLAGEGGRLALAARRAELLEEVAAAIVAIGRDKPVLISEDLLREGAPESIAKAALAGLGSVNILINNAGGSRPFKLDARQAPWHRALTPTFTPHPPAAHCPP